MRDPLFSGRDVAEALEAAGRSLGLAADSLRYVVLEPGSPGVLGMGGTPARIAILLDRPSRAPEAAAPARPGGAAGVRSILEALAAAAGIEIALALEETPEALLVGIRGPGAGFFLEREGDLLKAVEHLLQRMFGRELEPRRLALDCEGYRAQREERLRARARELAEAVRRDGKPRTTGPLNAYERRIVHLALHGEPGVRTFSVGEGGERRVTVAAAEDAPPGPPGPTGA